MEVLIGLGVCVALYFIFKKKSANTVNPNTDARVTISASTASRERAVPRGAAWQTTAGDNGLKLMLSKSVTLTIAGDLRRAGEVEKFLRTSAATYFPERAMQLAILMSRHNIECPEVEQWRRKTVAAIQSAAKKAVSAKHDTKALAQTDQDLLDDLMADAEMQAFDELTERPSYFRTFDELQIELPADLSSDDAFLESAAHDPKIIQMFSRTLGREGKVTVVSEGQGLPEWVEMANAGLAIRGTAIPGASLAEAYKLVEINAAAQPAKPIRKKADAGSLITPEVAARLPNINRAFLMKEVDPAIKKGMQDFGWAYCHACLLLETVRSAEHVNVQLEREVGPDEERSWTIDGDCCKTSANAGNRDSSRRVPANLPPYHVGCQARLEGF